MITGTLLLIWGIGIVYLAFVLQTKIQDAKDGYWKHVRNLYDKAPFIFCTCMGLSLALWPIVLGNLIYTSYVSKGTKHGN